MHASSEGSGETAHAAQSRQSIHCSPMQKLPVLCSGSFDFFDPEIRKQAQGTSHRIYIQGLHYLPREKMLNGISKFKPSSTIFVKLDGEFPSTRKTVTRDALQVFLRIYSNWYQIQINMLYTLNIKSVN